MIYYPHTSPSDSFLMILYPQRCDACQKQRQEISAGGEKGEGFFIFFQMFKLHFGVFQCYFEKKIPVNRSFIIQRTPRSFCYTAFKPESTKKTVSSFNWSKFWNRTKTLEEQQPNKNSSPKERSNESLFSIMKLFRQKASRHCCFNELARKLRTDPEFVFLRDLARATQWF